MFVGIELRGIGSGIELGAIGPRPRLERGGDVLVALGDLRVPRCPTRSHDSGVKASWRDGSR